MCCKQCRETEDIYRERARKEGLIFYKYECKFYEKQSFENLQKEGKIPIDAHFEVLE